MPLRNLLIPLAPVAMLSACATAAPPPLPPAPVETPTVHERIPVLVAAGSAEEGYRIVREDLAPATDSLVRSGVELNGDSLAATPVTVRLIRLDHGRAPRIAAEVPGTGGRARQATGGGTTFTALTVPLGSERAFPDRYDPEASLGGALSFLAGIRETGTHPALWLDLSAEEDLSAIDVAFLRAAVTAGVGIVVVPERYLLTLDGGRSLRSLRRDMGYDGIIAVHLGDRPPAATARGAVAALRGGADLVLADGDPLPLAESIGSALDRGELPLWRVDEAAARIEALLERSPEDAASASMAGARHAPAPPPSGSVVFLPAPHRVAPSALRGDAVVLLLHQHRDRTLADALTTRLRGSTAGVHPITVDAGPLHGRGGNELARGLQTADAVLLLGAAAALELAGRATREPTADLPPALMLAFGPDDPPALGFPVLWSRAADDDGLDALGRVLLGQAAPRSGPARFLVHPAPTAVRATAPQVGMSEEGLRRLDRLVEEALAEGHFSGAAVAVGRRGGLVRLRGYGPSARLGTGSLDDRSPFDLASLTKVVATTTAVMLLVDDGVMTLDSPVRRWLPEFVGPMKDRVTVGHLLEHSSGLPAGGALWRTAASPEHALHEILATPLRHFPGERTTYSDWGLVVLSTAVERAAGEPLDRFLARRLFEPLGMDDTEFLPPHRRHAVIAPTLPPGDRPFERRGIVHDPNAFRLGGIAGHAGLFSTARDLAVYAQMMLNRGAYGSTRLIRPGTVDRFVGHRGPDGRRALGWEVARDGNSAGPALSERAVGHTGYTGTSIWIDPEHELFVVLLTNRTYTGAASAPIMRLRRAVHEAAVGAIVDGEK